MTAGRARLLYGAVGLALSVLSIVLVAASDHETTPVVAGVLGNLLGWSFIGGGLVAWNRRPDNGSGRLMTAVGLAWGLTAIVEANGPVPFTIGLLVGNVFLAVFIHLLVAYPRGYLSGRFERFVVVAAYAAAVGSRVTLLLVNPHPEQGCRDCPKNVLLAADDHTLRTVQLVFWNAIGAAIAAAVVAIIVRRWREATAAGRRQYIPVAVAGLATMILLGVDFSLEPIYGAANTVLQPFALVTFLAVPYLFLVGLLRTRLARAAASQLLLETPDNPTVEEAEAGLRRALRDPTLRLLVWLDAAGGYVDRDGNRVDPPPDGPRQATTPIDYEGRPLAAVVHDRSLREERELLTNVLAAARLALEKDRSLRELQAAERRQRALLAGVPDFIFRISRDGTYLDYHAHVTNDVLADPSFIGSTLHDWMPADVADELLTVIRDVVDTGEPATYEQELPGHRRTAFEARIVKSGDDEVLSVVRDVTERKEREDELRRLYAETKRQEVRTRALLDALPDLMFRVRRDGTYADYHTHDDSELVDPDVVGRTVWERLPAAVAEVAIAAIRRALDEGGVHYYEYQLDLRGEQRYYEARVVASGDNEVVSIVRDITDRKVKEAEVRALVEEQAALTRVALAVATEQRPEDIFATVTEEVGRLLEADRATVVRFDGDSVEGVVVGVWVERGEAPFEVGSRFPVGHAPVEAVRDPGIPIRVDVPLTPADQAADLRRLRVSSLAAAPITVSGRIWGAMGVALSEPRIFPAGAEERVQKFANVVAVALANAEAREQLSASRARIVAAGDAERRRLERNLHDGAQQRLVSLSLALRLAQAKLQRDPDSAAHILDGAARELAQALEELRELARGIHPAILTDRGLGPALEAVAARAPLPVELEELPMERLPAPVEAAAFYVVSEALANVAKYAQAASVSVRVARSNGLAVVEVADDGVGGADPASGSGLRGLADRVEALDGRIEVVSPAGEGTRIRAEIPCA